MNSLPKVIFLLGPTAVGKTSVSISLAKDFNGEIISADSVQVFKQFDIGSAKVTKDEMQGIVHYGIDIKNPDQNFSASEYVEYTKRCITEILAKGKTPIIVGGTGLYVKGLTEGYNFGGTAKNIEFRIQMEEKAEREGLESLVSLIREKDSSLADSIDCKNKARVIRALEIAYFGVGKEKNENNAEYDFKIFALTMDREVLYSRINKRVDIMFDQGLVEEVKNLYANYGQCQPMTAIGYKELIPYIKGEITLDKAKDLIAQHSRNYAKRQMTFLRSIKDVQFVDVGDVGFYNKMKEEIEQWRKR